VIWLVLFVALRLAFMAACAWGVVHATSAGMSLAMSVGFMFLAFDTFRALVERRRQCR